MWRRRIGGGKGGALRARMVGRGARRQMKGDGGDEGNGIGAGEGRGAEHAEKERGWVLSAP